MASLFNPLGCSSRRDLSKKFFVHKKDCQSLNGVIDLSTYQHVYNIKIIFMCTIFLQGQPKNTEKIQSQNIHEESSLQ